jgi:HAD superfamily hydrolase (TIGR01458 family)
LTRAGPALKLEAMIQGALLDLAGVIYDGDHALPGALSAIERLREAGLSLRFVTNTTRLPTRKVLRRLAELGLDIEDSELFTPGEAARNWLAANDCSPSLLVHPNLVEEFAGEGGRPHRAVIIGDAGEDFDFARLNHAFRELIGGAPFIALAKNRSFKDDDGALSLDAGAFVTALEFATGREALVLGKPSPAFFQAALASMNCAPETAVMVGDDAESDIAGALDAGLAAAVLVRTGKYRAGDETRFSPAPTATVADLSAATEWILARRAP